MTALEARKIAEDEIKAGKTPKYTDLRDWLEIVDSLGELKKVDGVDWNLEMGTLAEIFARETKGGPTPAVLFDNVPGYPKGFRALFAQNASFKRMALNLGLDMNLSNLDLVRAFRQKLVNHEPIKHKVVTKGPILENVDSGDKVDLLKFPVPFMHELDGGRFIVVAAHEIRIEIFLQRDLAARCDHDVLKPELDFFFLTHMDRNLPLGIELPIQLC